MAPGFPNPFAAVAASVAATTDQLAGLDIEYRPAVGATVICRAIKARAQTDQAQPSPWLAVHIRQTEWLIDPDQTPAPPVPQAGDIIITDAGTSRAEYFRVYAPAGGPVWKWGGPLNRWRRVATEKINAPT